MDQATKDQSNTDCFAENKEQTVPLKEELEEKQSNKTVNKERCSDSLKHSYKEMSAEELKKLLEDSAISKNQKKKIKKELDWINTAEERRVQRRKRKIEKRDERREKLKVLAGNTAAAEEGDEIGVSDQKRKKLNRVKTTDNFEQLFHVAIDCSFDDLMTQKDIRKLAGQIMWCYKVNRRCNLPVQYHLFGMSERVGKYLDPSYHNWDVHFGPPISQCPHLTTATSTTNDQPNSGSKLVYLTAESDNVLEDVRPGVVYVIGGLVDHNHYKGHCHEEAVKKGYKTARLPLTEHVDMKTRRVLTVNHVFELLLARRELGDWKSAILKVLPPKKIDGVKSLES